jgi:hypothetical protein
MTVPAPTTTLQSQTPTNSSQMQHGESYNVFQFSKPNEPRSVSENKQCASQLNNRVISTCYIFILKYICLSLSAPIQTADSSGPSRFSNYHRSEYILQPEAIRTTTESQHPSTTATSSPALSSDVLNKMNQNTKPTGETSSTAKPASELPGALPIHSKVRSIMSPHSNT